MKQIIAPESLNLSHHGYEALSHASSKFLPRTGLTLYFLMLANMVVPSASQETAAPLPDRPSDAA